MKSTWIPCLGFAALWAAPAAADGELRIAADTPVVSVSPRPPGRVPLAVPELEYTFSLQVRCPGDQLPASVLLSVADARRVLEASELGGDIAAVHLRVPANQLAPIVLDNFCLSPPASSADRARASIEHVDPITIVAALTAHASLRCAGDGDGNESMRYVTEPLDVQLQCDMGSPDAGTIPDAH